MLGACRATCQLPAFDRALPACLPCPFPLPCLQLVRRWDPALLLPAAQPLLCHNHSVRTLAAGKKELIVSGDKGGEVAVWKV